MGLFDKPSYALRYAFSNEESELGPLLKLALVTFATILVIPTLTVIGYTYRVMENSMKDEPVPRFTGVLQLTKEGLVGSLILIPLSVFSSLILSAPVYLFGNGTVSVVLYFFAFLLIAYTGPIVVGLYVKTRTVSGTYNVSRIIQTATSARYLISMTGFFLFMFVAVFVLPLAGILIVTAPFISPLILIALSAYLGTILSAAFDSEESNSSDSSYTIPT
jgi:hypothetical protein